MRLVQLDTPKPLSTIGLGTWQFGSWAMPRLLWARTGK